MDLIDQKAWEIIRNTVRVEITGLQGSDASFTWHPEWWEVIEGTHPTIRNPGYESTFGTERPGRSEYAYFAGHLAAFAPGYAAIPRTDFKGKLVATLGQEEPLPKITIQHDRGEITSIEGGSHQLALEVGPERGCPASVGYMPGPHRSCWPARELYFPVILWT